MQNVDGATEASGYCRDEWQHFTKYFLNPLVQKKIKERVEREGPDSEVAKAVREWRTKLDGAYACLRESPRDGGLQPKERDCPGTWFTARNVSKCAYKPTTGPAEVPFFVTIDRSTAQNWWIVNKKDHVEDPGVPLLQVVLMPTRGHDLHQIVEHAIGAWKTHVYKALHKARAQGKVLTTKLVSQAVAAGSKLFTAASWDKNLQRLKVAIKIIAADKGQIVRVPKRDRDGNKIGERDVPGTGGGYCYVQSS